MKVGFLFPNIYSVPAALCVPPPAPPSLFDPAEGARSLDEGLELVRLADELGFDFISISEHHSMPLLLSPNAAVIGGALSQILKRASLAWLGPLVSINNPIRVAEEIGMLDQLMKGRFSVCLLRGTPNELIVYNNIKAEESRSITEEASLLIRRALTETEPFAHKGTHFDFPKVAVWPGSTQKPHPPIYSSGGSEDSVRFAAANRFRLAISFYPPHLVAKLTALYRAEAAQHGWHPTPDDILYRAFCIVGENDEHARELQGRFSPGPPETVAQPKELGTDADGKNHPGADKKVQGFGLGFLQFCGGPETVLKQLQDFQAETGVGSIDLAFIAGGLPHHETRAMVQRFGDHVLPALTAEGALSPQPA